MTSIWGVAGFRAIRAETPRGKMAYGLGLLVVAGLALIGTWIAFGPGERHFMTSWSAFGTSGSGAGDETIGRIVFGFGAVLCWLFLIAIARQGWRKLFPRS